MKNTWFTTKLFAVLLATAITWGISTQRCVASVTVASPAKFADALKKSSGLLNILAINRTKTLDEIIAALKEGDQETLNAVSLLAQDREVVSIAMTGHAEQKSNPAVFALQTLWYVLILKATEEFVKEHFMTEQSIAEGLDREAFIRDFKVKFATPKTNQEIRAALMTKIATGLNAKLTRCVVQVGHEVILINNAGFVIDQQFVNGIFTDTLAPLVNRITRAHNFTQKILATASTQEGLDTILFSECITITEPEHAPRSVTLYAFIQEESCDILNLLETGVEDAIEAAKADLAALKARHGQAQGTTIQGATTKARAKLKKGLDSVLAAQYTARMREVEAPRRGTVDL